MKKIIIFLYATEADCDNDLSAQTFEIEVDETPEDAAQVVIYKGEAYSLSSFCPRENGDLESYYVLTTHVFIKG